MVPAGRSIRSRSLKRRRWLTTSKLPPAPTLLLPGAVGAVRAGGSGHQESLTISGLEVGQEYSFALRAVDEAGNWSDLSNVPTAIVTQSPPVQVTFNTTFYGTGSPHWSPDGNSLVCYMGVSDRTQITVVPISGGSPEQYTFSSEGATQPSWSPDGSQFAIVARVARGNATARLLGVMASTPGASVEILADHG